ncbi:MAG: hypothetical protein AAGE65_13700 [Planctomycetota bacterium]
MPTISTLNTRLTLNTSNFRTGFQMATRTAQRWSRRTSGLLRGVGRNYFNLRLLATDAFRVIDSLSLDSIDRNAKFADSLGIPTQALGGMRHAATITGTAQTTLDKGLQRLTRTLGEATRGYGTGSQALQRLGLDIDQVAGQRPDLALGVIADRLNEIEDPAERAALAYGVFGRQGQEMLNFLALGSEGLALQSAEAERLGLTFNRVDAAKVEEANDAMARVRGVVTGLNQRLTIELAPAIEAVANRLLTAASEGNGFGQTVTRGMGYVSEGIAFAANGLAVFRLGWLTLRTTAQAVISYLTTTIVRISDGIETIAGALGFEYETPQWLRQFEAETLAMTDRLAAETASVFDDLVNNRPAENVRAFFDGLQAEADAAAANQAASSGPLALDEDAALAGFDNFDRLDEELRSLRREADRINLDETEIRLAGLDELGATNDELAEARDLLGEIDRAQRGNRVGDVLADLDREVRNFGLSDSELKLLDLEALGASPDQLDEARAKLEEIDRLRRAEDAGRDGRREALRAVTVGSAEAQRLAFAAAQNPGTRAERDRTPERQLAAQERTADALERIDRRGETREVDEGTWELL